MTIGSSDKKELLVYNKGIDDFFDDLMLLMSFLSSVFPVTFCLAGLFVYTPSILAQSVSDQGSDLHLDRTIINDSPVLQRWQEKIPNVLEDIRHDPSFSTRVRVGYSQFPSTNGKSGFNVGVEDIFVGKTGLTVSADYQQTGDGDRKSMGTELRYYVLPMGNAVNFAPVVGYRHLENNNTIKNGVNVGAKVMISLSRKGSADLSLSHTYVSPGTSEEVGITTLSVGYAVTPTLRLSTDIQKENSRENKDSRVGIVLEWKL